jgi:heme A synthase
LPHLRVLFVEILIPGVMFFLKPTVEALHMKPMLGLLALFVVATLVTVFAGSYGDGVVRAAGYVATLALGGVIALLIQSWKSRRPGARPPR